MKEKVIGVLFGGVSREREISLRSGKNIVQALKSLGYQVVALDIETKDCLEQLKAAEIDIAYNILHGSFGEDGGIQQILEELKIPYTGSGVKSSQNCFDKIECKKILIENNLPTAKYQFPQKCREITLTAPIIIKPISEGSSFGINIGYDQEKILEIFNKTSEEFGENIFIEEYISGVEITVGVLKENAGITVFPTLELVPKNKFYDFDAKYTPGGTEFILPARLSSDVIAKVNELAEKSFLALNCAGAVRVDMIVREKRDPVILEINTIPGMTAQSDLPAEAKEAGLSFEQLVEKILQTASLNKF